MALHRAFGALIESNIPLFDTDVSEEAKPDYLFQLLPEASFALLDVKWICQTALPDGSEWLSMAKRGSDYVLRFAEMADFVISSDRRHIRCSPRPGTPIETIRHLLLDQVFPCLLMSHNQLALHAGAVVINGEAVAFLGESGQGKSTLCASFGYRGHQLIGDDCLLVKEQNEKIFCVPSYPGVRLWAESAAALFTESATVAPVAHYSQKHRLSACANNIPFATEPAPLRKIYRLSPRESAIDLPAVDLNQVVIAPVAPNEAFKCLLTSSFRLDVYDRDEMKDEFNLISRILNEAEVSGLSFPREFAALPNVHQAIYADLA